MTFFQDNTPEIDRQYIVTIDSRDRDVQQYPNANDYCITMPSEYRNVSMIELRTVEFVSTQYAIDSTNNQIAIRRLPGPIDTLITLKEGTYTGPSLATELSLQLGDAPPGGGGISVVYDPDTGKYMFSTTVVGDELLIIDSTIPGTPTYSENLVWANIGLGQEQLDLTLPVAPIEFVTSERIDIAPDRYMIMEVLAPMIVQGRIKSTSNHHHAFAKIIFDSDTVNRDVQTRATGFVSQPATFQNIVRLERMHFRFVRPNGNLYNMHHINHSFTLRITTR